MRRRALWIALPIAIVFALWAGPGLSEEDELPPAAVAAPIAEPIAEPVFEPIFEPIFEPDVEPPPGSAPLSAVPPPTPQPHVYPECDEPAGPGPDGDQ